MTKVESLSLKLSEANDDGLLKVGLKKVLLQLKLILLKQKLYLS